MTEFLADPKQDVTDAVMTAMVILLRKHGGQLEFTGQDYKRYVVQGAKAHIGVHYDAQRDTMVISLVKVER